MTKLDTIKALDIKSLKELTKTLLGLMGFKNVREGRGGILAEEQSAISELSHIFILPEVSLTGNVDIISISSLIDHAIDSDSFNVITLVSNNHISSGFQSSLNALYPKIKINYIGRDKLISIIDGGRESAEIATLTIR